MCCTILLYQKCTREAQANMYTKVTMRTNTKGKVCVYALSTYHKMVTEIDADDEHLLFWDKIVGCYYVPLDDFEIDLIF